MMVDDNLPFLENIQEKLSNTFECIYNANPVEALDVIKKNHSKYYPMTLIHESKNDRLEDYVDTDDYITCSISSVRDIFNSNHLSDLISVVIVDYSMPELNGIQFATAMRDLPVKIILLTGEADNEIAVDAFNEQVINGYIQKDSKDLVKKITKMTSLLMQKYFDFIGSPISTLLSSQNKEVFHSKSYHELINDTIARYEPDEYCLLDNMGSYLFRNNRSEIRYLMMCDEKMLHDFEYTVKVADVKNNDLLNKLESRTHFPFLPNYDIDVADWPKYIQPIVKLDNDSPLYYASYHAQD